MLKFLSRFAKQTSFQSFYEWLHRKLLSMMNYGISDDFAETGELHAIHCISQRFRHEEEIIIFDVGANIGDYTNALQQVFLNYAAVTIHAFEPSTKTFHLLKENTKRQRGNIDIQHHCLALGEENSQVTLYSAQRERDSGIASLYQRELTHFKKSLDKAETIQMTTLTDFCRKHAISHIHFLKMDVEGHELAILKGSRSMLDTKAIDCIQFEFGGGNIDSRTFFQNFYYLLNDHYQIYRIIRDGLYPVHQYKEQYEIFLTTNFLAVRRDLHADSRK